jgi:chromosome segregation ATPase
MTNLTNYRKMKKVKEYLVELNDIRNCLAISTQQLAKHSERHSDIRKVYNEICETIQVYTKMIDTYTAHLKKLEENDGN